MRQPSGKIRRRRACQISIAPSVASLLDLTITFVRVFGSPSAINISTPLPFEVSGNKLSRSSLTTCSTCKGIFHEKAQTCPDCGCPGPTNFLSTWDYLKSTCGIVSIWVVLGKIAISRFSPESSRNFIFYSGFAASLIIIGLTKQWGARYWNRWVKPYTEKNDSNKKFVDLIMLIITGFIITVGLIGGSMYIDYIAAPKPQPPPVVPGN